MKKFILTLFIFCVLTFIIPNTLTAADYKYFNTEYNVNEKTISVNWINNHVDEKYTVYINDEEHDVTGLNTYKFSANNDSLYVMKLTIGTDDNESQIGIGSIYTGTINVMNVKLIGLNKTQLEYNKVKNASGYYIYRSINNKNNYSLIHKTSNNSATKFIDNNLNINNKYYYKVIPFYVKDDVKYSGYTNIEREVLTAVPVKVSGLKITQTNHNTNNLTWKMQKGITGYKIYYSNKKKSGYKKIGVTNTNNYNHTNLKFNKRYYYKVIAYKTIDNNDYYGPYSDIKTKAIKLVKPQLNVNASSKKNLKLTWSKTKYASYYEIYRANPKSKYKLIKTTKKTTYTDTNTKKYKTYYYKIRAVKKHKKKKYYSKYSNVDYETSGERNAKSKLDLISSYGDKEAYHPDALYFKDGWNGYKYWLAFTPYPNVKGSKAAGDYRKENPHIRVSNDLKHWKVPSFEANPLDEPDFNSSETIYNSDNDLIYNNILNRIECFWRTYTKDTVTLYMKYTTDGKKWSEKIEIYKTPNSANILLSPAIIYENGVYKIWYVHNWEIEYKEFNSIPFDNPIKEETVHIAGRNHFIYPWHLDVIKVYGKYRMIYVGTILKEHLRHMSLYYEESNDGIHFSNFTRVLNPSKDKKAWDNRGIYRSSFFYKDGKYYVFYSASNKNNEKGTGLIAGKKMNDLYPVFKK